MIHDRSGDRREELGGVPSSSADLAKLRELGTRPDVVVESEQPEQTLDNNDPVLLTLDDRVIAACFVAEALPLGADGTDLEDIGYGDMTMAAFARDTETRTTDVKLV